jgi:hypothetical protein
LETIEPMLIRCVAVDFALARTPHSTLKSEGRSVSVFGGEIMIEKKFWRR